MRRPSKKVELISYQAGTHPRDLRKLREHGIASEATPVLVKKSSSKPKKGAKILKISTKQ